MAKKKQTESFLYKGTAAQPPSDAQIVEKRLAQRAIARKYAGALVDLANLNHGIARSAENLAEQINAFAETL